MQLSLASCNIGGRPRYPSAAHIGSPCCIFAQKPPSVNLRISLHSPFSPALRSPPSSSCRRRTPTPRPNPRRSPSPFAHLCHLRFAICHLPFPPGGPIDFEAFRAAGITAALQSFGRAGVPLYVRYQPRTPDGRGEILPQILNESTLITRVSSFPRQQINGDLSHVRN